MALAVAMTAYRRPFYFKKVLESWAAVEGIHDVSFQIYLEPSECQGAMCAIAESAGFNLTVHQRPYRYGVLNNPWCALEETFDQYFDFVILAEDDVLVAPDVLHYFEFTYDQPQESLLTLAFRREPGVPRHADAVELVDDFCPLVWGLHKDKWTNYIRNTWDHDYSSSPNNQQCGWDWNIRLRVQPSSKLKVWRPLVSRSQHIGEFDGVHMMPVDYPGSRADIFAGDLDLRAESFHLLEDAYS